MEVYQVFRFFSLLLPAFLCSPEYNNYKYVNKGVTKSKWEFHIFHQQCLNQDLVELLGSAKVILNQV